MSQTAAALAMAPKPHYYSRADYLKQVEEAKRLTDPKTVGATAWLAGMTRDQYTAKLAAEGKKADPQKLYLHEQLVKRDTERTMQSVADRTYNGLVDTLPRSVRIRAVDPKPTALENMPHLGYARVGAMIRTNADGSQTPVVIYAANFKADPKVIDGKQVFENIRPQVDGVKNEPMYFAFALDSNNQLDKRFGKDGVVFRLSDPSKVAESCMKIAAPTTRANPEAMRPTPAMRQANRPEVRAYA
ncbi:DUF6656 family protein [Agrobacterium tumefaciens]|uniref:DUF6656 family protein n=1 Tax=Agrobacterium tumefaciens TaxID=358 RepID=UPI00157486A6|nr:hypothetical protein [Agrobacterium tumefaciens]